MTYASAVPQFAGGRGCGHGTHHRSGHGRPGWGAARRALAGDGGCRRAPAAPAAAGAGTADTAAAAARSAGFGCSHFGPARPRAPARGDVRAALLACSPRSRATATSSCRRSSTAVGRRLAPEPRLGLPGAGPARGRGARARRQREGGRAFTLTDAGREYVEAEPETSASLGRGQRGVARRRRRAAPARCAARRRRDAGRSAGDEAQVAEARKVLDDARRSLYRILAEDDPQSDAPTGTGTV